MIDRATRGNAPEGSENAAPLPVGEVVETIAQLDARLSGIEEVLVALRDFLAERKTIKESYTTAEAAALLGKRPYTVREWCRLGRIHAT
ncbi:MAG: helix-turn-helix domain-containing protein, partial [Planctomycetota bacterium]|nr:helix-turn-helix domain-containing protein [Planctomycetota bacterium]